jgi:hypothetical protein
LILDLRDARFHPHQPGEQCPFVLGGYRSYQSGVAPGNLDINTSDVAALEALL